VGLRVFANVLLELLLFGCSLEKLLPRRACQSVMGRPLKAVGCLVRSASVFFVVLHQWESDSALICFVGASLKLSRQMGDGY
jgi:hypothetical protein